MQILAVDILPAFLNTGATGEAFQQSGKQYSFTQILKSWASMYAGSGWQFFKTIARIQSGPNTFDESMLVRLFKPTWELQKYYAVPD